MIKLGFYLKTIFKTNIKAKFNYFVLIFLMSSLFAFSYALEDVEVKNAELVYSYFPEDSFIVSVESDVESNLENEKEFNNVISRSEDYFLIRDMDLFKNDIKDYEIGFYFQEESGLEVCYLEENFNFYSIYEHASTFENYDGIIYIVSPYGEDKQGFLPGDITKKSEIYYEPFYQALIKCGISPLVVIDNESQVSEKKKNSNYYIKCFTHTYLRGTNLDNKVVIVDEAQNFQTGDLKKTLTRLSDSCKTIVIGHEGQIDLTKKNTSGFMKFLNHFEGQPYSRSCTLTKNYRGIVSTWADELREV